MSCVKGQQWGGARRSSPHPRSAIAPCVLLISRLANHGYGDVRVLLYVTDPEQAGHTCNLHRLVHARAARGTHKGACISANPRLQDKYLIAVSGMPREGAAASEDCRRGVKTALDTNELREQPGRPRASRHEPFT